LGITTRTVSRWEQGLSMPYPYYREQLCALFGKNARELGMLEDDDDTAYLTEERGRYVPQGIAIEDSLLVVPDQETLLVDPAIPEVLGNTHRLLGRDDLLMQVKLRLLQGDSLALTALNGLPGIGKTALAVALATDREVQMRFCDGILWAGLGPH